MIFGKLNPEAIAHEILQVSPPHLSDVATLPWENTKKVIFTSIIHTYFWLFMLSQKTNCNSLAHPNWKCHHTNLCIAKLFHLTEGLLPSFKHRRLWKQPVVCCCRWLWKEPAVICGNWNVRQAISKQVFRVTIFSVNTCFVFFPHWSVAQCTTLCWNSAHVATSHCHKSQRVHINTHTPPVACPRNSTRAMQIIESIKQQ